MDTSMDTMDKESTMKRTITTCLTWAGLLFVAVWFLHGGEALAEHPAVLDPSGALPLIGLAGLIDIFDTRTMLEAIEQMKRPGLFLRDLFFPRAAQSETETVDVDIVKGKRRMAPFVSPLAEGKLVERLGFTTSTLKPGYIKPKMVTTAADLLHRQPGQILYSGGQTIESRAAAQLGKDLAELMDMIDRREEWMAAQALNAGTVAMTIKGETGDKTVTVDFQMAATHKITLAGTDVWSDQTNSNPVEDLQTWARLVRQDSGMNPTDVVLGSDASAAFIDHPKVQKLMDMRRVDVGEINPRQLPNGVSYVGRLKAPSLTVDVWTYDEWFVDDTTGTEGPAVPAKKVFMGSANAANHQLHAVIQDVEAIEGGQAAVKRFPKSWIIKDPGARLLMVQSAPLMALNQPDAFVSAQVLA